MPSSTYVGAHGGALHIDDGGIVQSVEPAHPPFLEFTASQLREIAARFLEVAAEVEAYEKQAVNVDDWLPVPQPRRFKVGDSVVVIDHERGGTPANAGVAALKDGVCGERHGRVSEGARCAAQLYVVHLDEATDPVLVRAECDMLRLP